MAEDPDQSPRSRRRKSLEHRSRRGPSGATNFLITGVTGFPRQGRADDAARPLPDVGNDHVLVRAPRRRDRPRSVLRQGRLLASLSVPCASATASGWKRSCGTVRATRGRRDRSDAPLSGGRSAAQTEARVAVINCAGLVTFNPSLELAVRVNTEGARNAAGSARRPAPHSSTSLPASSRAPAGARCSRMNRSSAAIEGARPGRGAHVPFVVEAELKDVDALVSGCARKPTTARSLRSPRRRSAASRTRAGDPKDQKAAGARRGPQAQGRLSQQLVQAGMSGPAPGVGPNTYTYTKAMGERPSRPAAASDALVGPPSWRARCVFPFPGWNEGSPPRRRWCSWA